MAKKRNDSKDIAGVFENARGEMVARSTKQELAIFNKLLQDKVGAEKDANAQRIKEHKELQEKLAKVAKEGNTEQYNRLEKQIFDLDKLIKESKDRISQGAREANEQATQISILYAKNAYEKMNAEERKAHQELIKDDLTRKKAAIDKELAIEAAKRQFLQEQYDSIEDKQSAEATNLARDIKASEQRSNSLENSEEMKSTEAGLAAVDAALYKLTTRAEKAAQAAENYKKAEEKYSDEVAKLKELEKAMSKATSDEEKEAIEQQINSSEGLINSYDKERHAAYELSRASEKAAEDQETLAEKHKKLGAAASKLINQGFQQVDNSLKNLYGNQAKMIGRLQGSDVDWKSSIGKVVDVVGMSGVLSQQNIVKKMSQLVDSGVAYNLELRAFLAETSESIAATFDAFDANLLRIIRLQQSDSTAARLGLEAALTTMLNRMFEDTSYLTSKASEGVSQAILDTSATMSRDDSLSFEYTLQKWLGSLYSIGMSQEGVTNIAKGINYLGIGNYEALSNDATLQTLLAMSAARAGLPYSELLKNTLTSADTNALLRSMVEYLAEIARSQEDYVTKSAYANLFGMSVTDLQTFANLTTSEIEKLSTTTMTASQMEKETDSQLSQLVSRLSVEQMVSTFFENVVTKTAQGIGSTWVGYAGWKALNLLDEGVKLEIPGFTALGSGTTSGISILDMLKAGYMGLGFLGSFAGGGNLFGGTSLADWSHSDTTSRGGFLAPISSGVTKTTSLSATMGTGSASSEDRKSASLESAKKDAYEGADTTSAELEEAKKIPGKILEAITQYEQSPILQAFTRMEHLLREDRAFKTVLTSDTSSGGTDMSSLLSENRVFYTAIVGTTSSDVSSKIINNSDFSKSNLLVGGDTPARDSKELSDYNNSSYSYTTTGKGSSAKYGTNTDISDERLQEIIHVAIYNALQDFSSGNSLPVTVGTSFGYAPNNT